MEPNTMKKETPKSATHTMIYSAVEPMRLASMDRAEYYMTKRINKVLEYIAENGGDVNALYPYPSSRLSREEYMPKLNAMKFAQRITNRGQKGRDEVIEEVRKAASLAFEAYVAKLAYKIGDGITFAGVTAITDLWVASDLEIERTDGTKEIWNTKVITNYSVYGLAFNQFPTRQVKNKKTR